MFLGVISFDSGNLILRFGDIFAATSNSIHFAVNDFLKYALAVNNNLITHN